MQTQGGLRLLRALRIKNLALVEDLNVAFDAGLNALTGETGAGKSILVGAMGLILGRRADPVLVRKGAQEASVEACFSLPADHALLAMAKDAGIVLGPQDDVMVRRVVHVSEKSRAFLNDQAISLATLERMAGTLLDLVGQHSHQALLKEEFHRELLDAFGMHGALRDRVRTAFECVQSLETQWGDLCRQEKEKQEKLAFWRFQSQEIAAAKLLSNEDADLSREMDLLSHAQKWQDLACTMLQEICEAEDSLTHRLAVLNTKLNQACNADAALETARGNVQEAQLLLNDCGETVRTFAEKACADPTRLALVQERLGLIEGLKRKYGKSLEELVIWEQDLQARIAALENIAVTKEDTQQRLEQGRKDLDQKADALSRARRVVAEKLSQRICKELADLGMKGVGLKIGLEPTLITDRGAENVRFLVAPNPGEGFKPLAAIASGGEISRVLLAIKVAFSLEQHVNTLVFDEVDANIGGAAATMVGQKLQRLATRHQVLVITHLPQIAHQAGTHFQVTKHVLRGRTITQIQKITGKERNAEMTRMIGGADIARQWIGQGAP